MKIAIVGGGGIGSTHARSYRAIGAGLVAVVEPVEASALRFRSLFEVPSYPTLADLIGSEDRPDAVSICTPPFAHRALVEEALAADIHVLCEKPMAHDLEDAIAIDAAAQTAGAVFAMAYCHRFQPEIEFVRKRMWDGTIGIPRTFHNSFSGYQAEVEKRWFGNPELSGGGVLIDAGIHSIDIFRYLCGEVTTINGTLTKQLDSDVLDVEHTAAVSLGSDRNIVGSIQCSWKTAGEEAIVRVTGDTASLTYDYGRPGEVVLTDGDGSVTVLECATGNRFQHEMSDFIDAIEQRREPRSTSRDGLLGVEAVAAVYTQTFETNRS